MIIAISEQLVVKGTIGIAPMLNFSLSSPPTSTLPIKLTACVTHRIRTDHNNDNTSAIFAEWAHNVRQLYHSVDFKSSEKWLYPNFDPFMEHEEKFIHLAQLRQEGLETARKSGADYLLGCGGGCGEGGGGLFSWG